MRRFCHSKKAKFKKNGCSFKIKIFILWNKKKQFQLTMHLFDFEKKKKEKKLKIIPIDSKYIY